MVQDVNNNNGNGKSKYLLVPGNPSNMFNDPWNFGVLCGSIFGMVGAYFFTGRIVPYIMRSSKALLVGHSKLALIVNADLGMTKGKVASQCSHASVLAYERVNSVRYYRNGYVLLSAWRTSGQPKVVLRAPNLLAMKEIEKKAKAEKIPVCYVQDAGRTQVPVGSVTVLAVGPSPDEAINRITSHLRLY